MVVPRPSTYFSEALISAQFLTAGSLRCPVGVNIPSLVASRSFHFARAKHALGEQGVAQVEARARKLGVVWDGWGLVSKARCLCRKPLYLVTTPRSSFCPQMWPAGSQSTGPMTAASSTPSASSSGTRGAMASCCQPRRSSPRPRRRGWPFGPSWSTHCIIPTDRTAEGRARGVVFFSEAWAPPETQVMDPFPISALTP